MKAGWAKNNLGEVLAVLRNGVNCKQDKDGQGEKVSRIESIADATFNPERVGYAELSSTEKERYRLLSGDILFSHINSAIHVGKTAIFDSDEEVYHGVNLLLMRPKPEVVPAYLNYALKLLFQSGYWKRTCKQSVNQASVNQQDISKVEIQYPRSIAEQHRIVAILDEAFDGIATAKANAEKNHQNARALFESHLQKVFTERGEGWGTKPLGEIAAFRNGINFTKSSKGTAIKILGVKDFQNHYWAPFENFDSIIPDGIVPDSDTLIEGDIVFVRSNGNPDLIGRCVLIGKLPERTTHSGFTIKARLQSNEVVPAYLCHFLKSSGARREMIDGGNGANIKSLNQGTLSRIVVPFPSHSKQVEIVRQLESVQDETQHLESLTQQKLTALDDLKKSLLHQAFSGQL